MLREWQFKIENRCEKAEKGRIRKHYLNQLEQVLSLHHELKSIYAGREPSLPSSRMGKGGGIYAFFRNYYF
jgi:hypothetical protein